MLGAVLACLVAVPASLAVLLLADLVELLAFLLVLQQPATMISQYYDQCRAGVICH